MFLDGERGRKYKFHFALKLLSICNLHQLEMCNGHSLLIEPKQESGDPSCQRQGGVGASKVVWG